MALVAPSLSTSLLGSFRGTSSRRTSTHCLKAANFQTGPEVQEVKLALLQNLDGMDRGIFGVATEKRTKIMEQIELLESMNSCISPTEHLQKLEGEWQLLYSTITILGAKRTKLGMRGFISLGSFSQIIDVQQSKAVNIVGFKALGKVTGSLTITASYSITSPTRVDIEYESSTISPDQLRSLFRKNYELLLSIFNPAGWLEITYVDDEWRIGHDDKGNVFLLQRPSL